MILSTFVSLLGVAIILFVIAVILRSIPLIVLSVVCILFVSIWFNAIRSISNYYHFEDPKIDALKSRIAQVIPEINKIQIYGSNKSFTINKRTTYICSKKDNGAYYTDNMLIYVILHELAHALCSDIDDHSKQWESIFDKLLERAEKGGVYDSSIPLVDGYCGY